MEQPDAPPLRREKSVGGDQRRYRRVEVSWDVAAENISRFEWPGRITSFGPYGMKVRLDTTEPGLSAGNVVRTRFAPPDGQPPLSVEGVVCRVDPDGVAITFINLRPQTFDRLKGLVDVLLAETI